MVTKEQIETANRIINTLIRDFVDLVRDADDADDASGVEVCREHLNNILFEVIERICPKATEEEKTEMYQQALQFDDSGAKIDIPFVAESPIIQITQGDIDRGR